jgi:hypothetical protein
MSSFPFNPALDYDLQPISKYFDQIDQPQFEGFGKIPRLFRDMVITEKIDGTNAAVGVTATGAVYAQSRKRIITPENDNYGFAKWVQDHADELRDGLGEGLHFGEWWGQGIQRGYGLDEKRFSLFNTKRWRDPADRPWCCHIVPVLAYYTFNTGTIELKLNQLKRWGSQAAPGYMNPEGIVVYHTGANALFKVTLENDDQPKGQ